MIYLNVVLVAILGILVFADMVSKNAESWGFRVMCRNHPYVVAVSVAWAAVFLSRLLSQG